MSTENKPTKKQSLEERMLALRIYEDDLIEKFILGSGSGGQKINKTSSCVYLQHIPTGIEIKCQQERSRELNRALAREELCKRIEILIRKERDEKRDMQEKERRRNRKASKRAKARRVSDKRQSSAKKSLRRKPSADH